MANATTTLHARLEKAVMDSTTREECLALVEKEAMVDISLLTGVLRRASELMGLYPVIPGAQDLYDTVNVCMKQYSPDGKTASEKKA